MNNSLKDFDHLATDLHVTHEIMVKLERAKRISDLMIYKLPELVLVIDETCRILSNNETAERVLEVKRSELLFSKIQRLFSERSWQFFLLKVSELKEAHDREGVVEFDLPTDGVNLKVRHYHWNLKVVPSISLRRGKLFFVIGHDITEIRLMLEKIQESHEKLEAHSRELQELLEIIQKQKSQIIESSKLAQLGEMAGGIAHEINNPITIIRGHAEHLQQLIQMAPIDSLSLGKSAKIISSTVDRIAAIVKSMRTLARDAAEDPFVPADIGEIIREALIFFRESFKLKSIELRSKIPEVPVLSECRAVQISQVVVNLLSNARDAIVDKNYEPKWVEIELTTTPTLAKITVTDCGPGIAEEIATKIMQPFFTTKPVGHGTGLGLSISNSIMSQHKGELILDRAHANTRFIALLPLKQPHST